MINDHKCQFCGSQIPADHAYWIGEKMVKHGWTGWEGWADYRDGQQVSVPGLGVVTMVAKSIAYGEEQGEDSRPVFMIFEVNGQYYRKNGTADSYGEINWNAGGFLPAVQKTVEVKTWETA